MQRHAYLSQLETRSGVRKYRQQPRSFTPTPFGSSRRYATSGLDNRLSRSRDVYAQDCANDLRGLLHVDYPGVVSKLAGHSEEASEAFKPQRYSEERAEAESDEMKQCMKEMDDFDSKEKKPPAESRIAFLTMIQGNVH